ncbi:farnesol dehydrogenase-like [Harmonia axyridis]|uniref:farnesol dehydrogenase-like n=1 Tax=Harmonia axyridis TaxID=115357 RepID=UPI001E276301|nr:farnesol dehydrogenase-like [Harmonia axyridis]
MAQSIEKWIGKVAVVTGASSGIGAKIAEILVKNGMLVVGIARRDELIENLSKQLNNEAGKLFAMKVDVTIDEELIGAFHGIEEKYGAIHVLVNNSGIFPQGPLLGGDIALWRKVMDTNLLACCISTREAIRIMTENEVNGQIININSVAGHYVPDFPNLNLYPASKHGVTTITETFRRELIDAGSKIKVTSISPGFVLTEGVKHTFNVLEIESILQPEDIAQAVIYVLSTPERVNVNEIIIKPVGQRI